MSHRCTRFLKQSCHFKRRVVQDAGPLVRFPTQFAIKIDRLFFKARIWIDLCPSVFDDSLASVERRDIHVHRESSWSNIELSG